MKNNNHLRIQDSPEYILVKKITDKENQKNILDAVKSFAIFMTATFVSVWLFTTFLLNIESITQWWQDLSIEGLIIDLIIWLKKINF